jgi:hypothetical protein
LRLVAARTLLDRVPRSTLVQTGFVGARVLWAFILQYMLPGRLDGTGRDQHRPEGEEQSPPQLRPRSAAKGVGRRFLLEEDGLARLRRETTNEEECEQSEEHYRVDDRHFSPAGVRQVRTHELQGSEENQSVGKRIRAREQDSQIEPQEHR